MLVPPVIEVGRPAATIILSPFLAQEYFFATLIASLVISSVVENSLQSKGITPEFNDNLLCT